jgi:hypothetical protein
MKVEILTHSQDSGWSSPIPGDVDSDRTLALVFGASAYFDRPAALAELRAALPETRLLGCSTSGEIVDAEIFDHSLSVAIARFEHTELEVARAPVESAADSFAAGSALGERLKSSSLTSVLVLSDGLLVNGSELVRGLNGSLGDGVLVTGGLAGDGDRFERTWVLEGSVPRVGVVSAVGFYGDRLKTGHGSRGGWDIFGPERRVTRSKDNVLFELDGQPALKLYRDYLGERADGLPATGLLFPLALRNDAEPDKHLVRTILAVDSEAESLTFAGDIPQGSRAQLMKANFDRLVEGAGEAALLTANGVDRDPTLAVAISCVGRRLVLGERTEDEVEATLDALPDGARQVGFYSYGELSPYANGACDLHNQTMTLTTYCEH